MSSGTGSAIKIALAQINPTVGDIKANTAMIIEMITAANRAKVDLVVFPELAVTGYPPEDLLLKRHFLEEASTAIDSIEEFVSKQNGPAVVVGYPQVVQGRVYNSAALIGEWLNAEGLPHPERASYQKIHLPNYGVFDEQRYFQSGVEVGLYRLKELKVGVTICEDIWIKDGPHLELARQGADLVFNLSASPYHSGKTQLREDLLRDRAKANSVPVVFTNLVGGQDELVFDGCSTVIDADGEVRARADQFKEELLLCEVPLKQPIETAKVAQKLEPNAEIYQALSYGLRDYVRKNGFKHVTFGLSGGIDSALVACIAADAVGAENVTAVVMPSPYSSGTTQGDAHLLAKNLNIRSIELPIADVMTSYTEVLSGQFAGKKPDLTEENLQARIRGNLLMALSNKFGWLVLTTGNKSEMAVGYSTLYGDSAGGFAVIKDCFKLLVYELTRYRNGLESNPLVPLSIIDRPPSAELRPDQQDSDSLPPYEVLDAVLLAYIENDCSREQLIEFGHPPAVVDQVIRLVDRAEYKRRQSPPGIKITPKAFGRDRRMPITNGYLE